MPRKFVVLVAAIPLSCLLFMVADANRGSHQANLPTSKALTVPVPGFVGRTNSYPATIAISPDGRYAALLNQGYGTEQSGVRQSIAILDLSNNQLRDFPDDRLRGDEKATLQSYFIGLAFSSDGKRLYASMASITENGIAVYGFAEGQVTPERFITVPPQRLARGKKVTFDAGKHPAGTAPPYPAGLAVLPSARGDRLLVANNLSDNVILLDATSGRILQSFDVSISKYIPGAYPYTVVANRAGTKAWVSLWNGSAVAELGITNKKVRRRIELWRPSDPVAPGTHPTAMLLNRSEDILYVALANASTTETDGIAAVELNKKSLPLHTYRVSSDNAPVPPRWRSLFLPMKSIFMPRLPRSMRSRYSKPNRPRSCQNQMACPPPSVSFPRSGIPARSRVPEMICSSPVPKAKAAGATVCQPQCRRNCIPIRILTLRR